MPGPAVQLARPVRRCAGVAMVLVMIAVAVSLVIVTSYISAQSTSLAIASNISSHAQARLIAESALQSALAYIQTHDDWRTAHADGQWIASASLAGGTFTLGGHDGIYNTATGLIEGGDGDLADDPADPLTITVTGRFANASHTVRSVVTCSVEEVASASRGLALQGALYMSGSAEIDSWNSDEGSYSATKGSDARVDTNATGIYQVQLSNSATVKGDVYVGPGGSPDAVIATWGSSQITGVEDANTEPVAFTTPEVPDLGSSQGHQSYWKGVKTISSNMRCSGLVVSNNADLVISGDVTIVCDGDFTLCNNAELKLQPGATLTLYVKGAISLSNNAKLNANTANPGSVQIYSVGSSQVNMSNNAQAYARIESPAAGMWMSNNVKLYGTYQGQYLGMSNSASFHQDLAGGSAGGGTGSDAASYTMRWVETP